MSFPDPDAPRMPDPYRFLFEVTRRQDGDGVLRAFMGEGGPGFELATVPGGLAWDPLDDESLEGLWGLVNFFAAVCHAQRIGQIHDPVEAPADYAERIALRRGMPEELIEAVRALGTTPDEVTRNLRKLGVLAPMLLAWKASANGGGVGGILRAVRAYVRARVVLRECFYWQTFVGVAGSPEPLDAIVGRNLSTYSMSSDPWIFDLFVVDSPVAAERSGIRDVVKRLVDLSRPKGETVHLHFVRWVDDFAEEDAITAGDWTSTAVDTVVTVEALDVEPVPPADPRYPRGRLVLTLGASGAIKIQPATCDYSLWGADALNAEHFLDVVLALEAFSGTKEVAFDLNLDAAGGTGAAYRVTVRSDGRVQILADNPGPTVTVRASATGVFLPGLITGGGVLRVTVTVTVLGSTKRVRVYVDGAPVLTWIDSTLLHATDGTFRLDTSATSCRVELKRFLYTGLDGPQLVRPRT